MSVDKRLAALSEHLRHTDKVDDADRKTISLAHTEISSMLVHIEYLLGQLATLEHMQEQRTHKAIAKRYGIKRVVDQ